MERVIISSQKVIVSQFFTISSSCCNPIISLKIARLAGQWFWTALILLSFSPGKAWSQDIFWTLPADQAGDWSVASNWGGTLPTSNDNAFIANGGTAIINSTGSICNNLYVGTADGRGYIQMLGGYLLINNWFFVGYRGVGSFTQTAGINEGSMECHLNISNCMAALCLKLRRG
jgi:hypothetical protein